MCIFIVMKTYALRLYSGMDLKEQLLKFTREKHISAGAIVTCVGSVSVATLRLADGKTINTFSAVEGYEICSLVGTLSQDGLHLHMSLADSEGKAFGGHVKSGCLINATAEIVVCELESMKFSREFDEQTGFQELVIYEE